MHPSVTTIFGLTLHELLIRADSVQTLVEARIRQLYLPDALASEGERTMAVPLMHRRCCRSQTMCCCRDVVAPFTLEQIRHSSVSYLLDHFTPVWRGSCITSPEDRRAMSRTSIERESALRFHYYPSLESIYRVQRWKRPHRNRAFKKDLL